MILRRANPLQGPLEGGGPENRDFLGSEMTTSEASAIWAQKVHKNRHMHVRPKLTGCRTLQYTAKKGGFHFLFHLCSPQMAQALQECRLFRALSFV